MNDSRPLLVALLCAAALAGCGSTPTQSTSVPDFMRTVRAADEQYYAGKFDAAERLYREVLEIDPRYVDAHLRLGVIAHHRNDYATAEAKFKEVLARDPRNTSALYNLSAVHMEQAHEYLERYLQLSSPKADQRTQVYDLVRAIEAFAKK